MAAAAAFQAGDTSALKKLLKEGASADFDVPCGLPEGGDPWPALVQAVHDGDVKTMRLLVKHGADVNAVCTGGGRRRTVLHVAAESGAPTALAAVELLVGAGAAMCAEDEDGWTPCDRAILLKRACNMKRYGAHVQQVVRALLHDPGVHQPPYKATRPPPSLHPACRTGNVTLLKLLVAVGGSAIQAHPGPPGSEAFDSGWLPIHTACRLGQLEAARFLLEQGLGTAFQTDRRGRTPLHSLFETDHGCPKAKAELASILLKKGANVNAQDKDGCEPGGMPAREPDKWSGLRKLLLRHKRLVKLRDSLLG